MDKIYIRGLRVYAYHGVKETEKEKGQPFELDITLEADLRRPGATDDLNDTVNYSKVTKRVLAVMQAEKNDLIEPGRPTGGPRRCWLISPWRR